MMFMWGEEFIYVKYHGVRGTLHVRPNDGFFWEDCSLDIWQMLIYT